MISLDSSQLTLLVCGPNGTLDQGVVGVNAAQLAAPEPAVLYSHPGDPLGRSEGVMVHGFADVPPGTLAIGQELAARLDLTQYDSQWRLANESVALVRAEALELELTTVDVSLDEAAAALSAAGRLAGRLLYAASPEQIGALSLARDGEEYRVRRIHPEPVQGTSTLYRVDESTEVQLCSSGVQRPVDIVVLADTSRSMGVPDLRERASRNSSNGSARPLSRMDAVKLALGNLLKERMTTPGRLARFALVAFADDCRLVFPALGGMAELDENTPKQILSELETAITRLQPKGDTNLGRALKFAGELLAKHSAPGNDRLIVLISDGAEGASDGGEGEGDMLQGVEAPVSLASSLSTQMNVRLHAIGISSPEVFKGFLRRMQASEGYAARAHSSWVPNHRLLRSLVRVSGGDPERVGDADVLLDYFDELAQGVSHRVKVGGAVNSPELTEEELGQLREHQAHAGAAHRAKRREELARDTQEAFNQCDRFAQSVIGVSLLYKSTFVYDMINGRLMWATDVQSRAQCAPWWSDIHKVFCEAQRKQQALTIPGLREIWHGERMSDLWQLRNWLLHNQDLPDRRRDLEKSRRILRKFVGISEFADDDHETWSRLQLALLSELRELWQECQSCLDAAARAKADGTYQPALPEPSAAEEPAPKVQPGPALFLLSAPPLQTRRSLAAAAAESAAAPMGSA
jgi:Mg-chelatase subunit ChlD